MSNQPFYHLRPNKNIDRQLFAQTLVGLSGVFTISEYQYTGFGSYLFDDFKLLHDVLNIHKMVSLEKDPIVYERAEFNCPYGCITIKNTGSTEYFSELLLDDKSHNIFWLDYVVPSELGIQLADFATLLSLLNDGDVVRITLNANPSSLGEIETNVDKLYAARFNKLKERVPEDYFPIDATAEQMATKEYPLLLLKIIKNVAIQCLRDDPPYSPNYLMPLFSSVYADGQQMLTFTGIVLNSHDKENEIKKALKNYPHNNFSWDNPCSIEIPELSVMEIASINKYLPDKASKQCLKEKFPFIFSTKNEKAIESYISFYKYYPNFHHVSF